MKYKRHTMPRCFDLRNFKERYLDKRGVDIAVKLGNAVYLSFNDAPLFVFYDIGMPNLVTNLSHRFHIAIMDSIR